MPLAIQSILETLDRCGAEWEARRTWTFKPLPDITLGDQVHAHGPGLLILWGARKNPVVVHPIPAGDCATSLSAPQWLSITCRDGSLTVIRNGTLVGTWSHPGLSQNLGSLLESFGQDRGSRPPWSSSCRDLASALSILTKLRSLLDSAAAPTLRRRNGRNQQLASDLHHWLKDNLIRCPQLDDVASEFDVSRRHLSRLLEECSSLTFAKHLALVKVIQARRLLMRSGDTIGEIAIPCGFPGREQFIRSFKEMTGWTPLQFRKSWEVERDGKGDISSLCQLSGRREVLWLQGRGREAPEIESSNSRFTLTIVNASPVPVDILQVMPGSSDQRIDTLLEGEMTMLPSVQSGSLWATSNPRTGKCLHFHMPRAHVNAMIPSSFAE